jgi:hypothetical protein
VSLRFRRSIKLAPGIRWNFSGSGTSWTLGPRGASISVGKRGTFLNTGIPGTGFYSRERIDGPSLRSRSADPSPGSQSAGATTTKTYSMTCGIQDDGTLYFHDASGVLISEQLVEVAKKQNKKAILDLIQRKCDEINDQVESLGRLHHDTPDSRLRPRFVAPPFDSPHPTLPVPRKLGLLDKIFRSRRLRVQAANEADEEEYRAALSEWKAARASFQTKVEQRRFFVEKRIYQDVKAMESFLEESLHDIGWPRETLVAIDIQDEGARVMLDVDLPELEDMPHRTAAVPARGLKLSVKELTPTKVQRLYADHVHCILFRLIGEVFAALPKAKTVVASGYSQRADTATGKIRDDYLLSVRADRQRWQEMDFEQLARINVIDALARHDLRTELLKSGKLKAITPHMQ